MAAAEANSTDILKLYNQNGNLITISNSMPPNTIREPYRLEIIIKNIGRINKMNSKKKLVINSFLPIS